MSITISRNLTWLVAALAAAACVAGCGSASSSSAPPAPVARSKQPPAVVARDALAHLDYNRSNLTAMITELRKRPGSAFSDLPPHALSRFFVADATCTRRRAPIGG